MALTGYEDVVHELTDFFASTAAMEVGGIVVFKTVGSGNAFDDVNNTVEYAASASGKVPVGMLCTTVINADWTANPQNKYRNEANINQKVNIMTNGVRVTSMIYPGLTITAGQTAYLSGTGLITNVYVNDAATPKVGTFLSSKNHNGFAKVKVQL